MYKLVYPSIRVRTAPPVSVRVSVSFSYGVTLAHTVLEFGTAISRFAESF